MDDALTEKLKKMEAEFTVLEQQLTASLSEDADSSRVQKLLSEHGRLRKPVELWRRCLKVQAELEDARGLEQAAAEKPGPESEDMLRLAEEEVRLLKTQRQRLTEELKGLFATADSEAEQRDAVLELRAGTGGDEAGIFAADLLRMYARYAARNGWQWQPVRLTENESGGCREATVMIGGDCYGRLAPEAGVHRVQRVPRTESQGRIHTSTCTVVVLPQVEPEDDMDLPPEDLRTDTFRASGAGGQHVNKTDSAVRVTHLPTGMSAECQEDRSQHRNRATALAILKARLLQMRYEEQREREEEQRRDMIGGARRAEKIRTYNFPQQRITDHRLKKSFHRLQDIMDGDLDEILEAFAG